MTTAELLPDGTPDWKKVNARQRQHVSTFAQGFYRAAILVIANVVSSQFNLLMKPYLFLSSRDWDRRSLRDVQQGRDHRFRLAELGSGTIDTAYAKGMMALLCSPES